MAKQYAKLAESDMKANICSLDRHVCVLGDVSLIDLNEGKFLAKFQAHDAF